MYDDHNIRLIIMIKTRFITYLIAILVITSLPYPLTYGAGVLEHGNNEYSFWKVTILANKIIIMKLILDKYFTKYHNLLVFDENISTLRFSEYLRELYRENTYIISKFVGDLEGVGYSSIINNTSMSRELNELNIKLVAIVKYSNGVVIHVYNDSHIPRNVEDGERIKAVINRYIQLGENDNIILKILPINSSYSGEKLVTHDKFTYFTKIGCFMDADILGLRGLLFNTQIMQHNKNISKKYVLEEVRRKITDTEPFIVVFIENVEEWSFKPTIKYINTTKENIENTRRENDTSITQINRDNITYDARKDMAKDSDSDSKHKEVTNQSVVRSNESVSWDLFLLPTTIALSILLVALTILYVRKNPL